MQTWSDPDAFNQSGGLVWLVEEGIISSCVCVAEKVLSIVLDGYAVVW